MYPRSIAMRGNKSLVFFICRKKEADTTNILFFMLYLKSKKYSQNST